MKLSPYLGSLTDPGLVAGDGLHVGGQDEGLHGEGEEQAQVCPRCGEGSLPLLSLRRKV